MGCEVYLGLGANVGDRRQSLRRAAAMLSGLGGRVWGSDLYETEPREDLEQPAFLNAVLGVSTGVTAREVLEAAQAVEATLGRLRDPGRPKGPRLIDVDVLLVGQAAVNEPGLVIPHPAMASRRFVLAPLAELAPGLVIPGGTLTVAELLERCPDEGWIRPLGLTFEEWR